MARTNQQNRCGRSPRPQPKHSQLQPLNFNRPYDEPPQSIPANRLWCSDCHYVRLRIKFSRNNIKTANALFDADDGYPSYTCMGCNEVNLGTPNVDFGCSLEENTVYTTMNFEQEKFAYIESHQFQETMPKQKFIFDKQDVVGRHAHWRWNMTSEIQDAILARLDAANKPPAIGIDDLPPLRPVPVGVSRNMIYSQAVGLFASRQNNTAPWTLDNVDTSTQGGTSGWGEPPIPAPEFSARWGECRKLVRPQRPGRERRAAKHAPQVPTRERD